jgi:hypothetical protein
MIFFNFLIFFIRTPFLIFKTDLQIVGAGPALTYFTLKVEFNLIDRDIVQYRQELKFKS